MTTEQAINLLNNSRPKGSNAYSLQLNEAIDKAVRALEQDCISRTDILDAIGHGTTYTTDELQKIIKGLPTVNLNSERNSL